MHPFGRGDTSWINVEAEIIDLWKPRQYLRRTTSDIDDLITRFGSDMMSNKLLTQGISPNGVLQQVVKERNL
jgi:hypothetical protein